jgi:hypothetical protein
MFLTSWGTVEPTTPLTILTTMVINTVTMLIDQDPRRNLFLPYPTMLPKPDMG